MDTELAYKKSSYGCRYALVYEQKRLGEIKTEGGEREDGKEGRYEPPHPV